MFSVQDALGDFIGVLQRIQTDRALPIAVEHAANAVAASLRAGGRVLFAGNGGSAADAEHLAGEFIGRFLHDRPSMAGIALTSNAAVITAVGNDFGFSEIFARQIEALGRPGDVFVALSTSGYSINVIKALKVARSLGITTIGLTGRDGGDMAALCDIEIRVPSDSTPLIQQAHMAIGHLICAHVERALHPAQAKRVVGRADTPLAYPCVLLVGGSGTRLGSLTQATPKPLLPVAGRPFLDHLLDEIVRQGFTRVVLLAGFEGLQIVDRYRGHHSCSDGVVDIEVIVETTPAGTGGALAGLSHLQDNEFLLMNGDSWFDIDLRAFVDSPLEAGLMSRMALCRVPDARRYGTVRLDGERVTAFVDRGTPGENLINAGIYRISRALLDFLPSSPCSLEADILPRLASAGQLQGRVLNGSFVDIGVPEDYALANQLIASRLRQADHLPSLADPLTISPPVVTDRNLPEQTAYVDQHQRGRWGLSSMPSGIALQD